MDEVANFNELLASHLVANPGRDAINCRIIPHARVVLERHLQIPEGLNLVHEGHEFWVVLGVEQVVLKNGKFARVGEGVILAVFFLQKSVNLGRGEFVRIAALDLSDDGVAWLDALTVRLAHQIPTDDVLGHGHRSLGGAEGGEVEFTALEGLGKREETTVFNDELCYRVVLSRELRKRNGFTVLQSLEHGVVAHQLPEVDVVAFVNRGKGGGDDDANACPTLALSGGFST